MPQASQLLVMHIAVQHASVLPLSTIYNTPLSLCVLASAQTIASLAAPLHALHFPPSKHAQPSIGANADASGQRPPTVCSQLYTAASNTLVDRQPIAHSHGSLSLQSSPSVAANTQRCCPFSNPCHALHYPSLTPTYTHSACAQNVPLHNQTAYGHVRYEDDSTTCIDAEGHFLSCDTYEQPHNFMPTPCHDLSSLLVAAVGAYRSTNSINANLGLTPKAPYMCQALSTNTTSTYRQQSEFMEGLIDLEEPWSLFGVEVPPFDDDAPYCTNKAKDTSMCSHLPPISHNSPSSLNKPHIHFITPPICDVSHTSLMSSCSDYVCVFTISLTHIITHNEHHFTSLSLHELTLMHFTTT
ncbi:hypothetical protein GOP47_0026108 [Adiantum capillus-veneris]|uniref:Uncharacterized protein n=1 Tax=Adiantum capillus-veneris TaxID=13818 RepID=A0A9D4U3M3_ADICA|nr:hypothetical protein GOP47_0026108 [Adiantum capillus-veneris]